MSTLGGVARRTGPPECSGTCSWSFDGFFGSEGLLSVGVWINVMPDWALGVASRLGLALPCVGVPIPVFALVAEASFPLGLAGKVENGPSWTLRLLGGRPRSLPDAVLIVDGQAEETAGP